jgi:hypothetical protein
MGLTHMGGIVQAPFVVPPVISGSRFVVYCMLAPGSTPPTNVVIRANTPDGPLAVDLAVTPDSVLHDSDVLHTLAARALIQDLEVCVCVRACVCALDGGGGGGGGGGGSGDFCEVFFRFSERVNE